MRCPNCDTVSLSACCPRCGACEVTCPQLAGFDPTDLFNPIGLGYDVGTSFQQGGVTGAVKDTTGAISSLANTVKDTTGAISSLANTMKWVAIGGATILGGLVIYAAVKFIPKMAEAASENVKEAARVGGRIAERAA